MGGRRPDPVVLPHFKDTCGSLSQVSGILASVGHWSHIWLTNLPSQVGDWVCGRAGYLEAEPVCALSVLALLSSPLGSASASRLQVTSAFI